MPELPEVETVKRELARVLVGKKIKIVKVLAEKSVRPLSPNQFEKKLKGKAVESIARRAKMLILKTGPLFLAIHLKMTGQLIYLKPGQKSIVGGHPQVGGQDNLPNRFTRLIFNFTDNSSLYFNDLRKFGWLRLFNPAELSEATAHYGLEPLSPAFTLAALTSLVERYPKRPVKQVLLDQTLIAGIGNIYADEACFLAKIKPTRPAGDLNWRETRALHESIVTVLKLSIKKKGTSSRNYLRSTGEPGGFSAFLNVYGRGKQQCLRCGTTLSKINFRGRGTHFCPKCQK